MLNVSQSATTTQSSTPSQAVSVSSSQASQNALIVGTQSAMGDGSAVVSSGQNGGSATPAPGSEDRNVSEEEPLSVATQENPTDSTAGVSEHVVSSDGDNNQARITTATSTTPAVKTPLPSAKRKSRFSVTIVNEDEAAELVRPQPEDTQPEDAVIRPAPLVQRQESKKGRFQVTTMSDEVTQAGGETVPVVTEAKPVSQAPSPTHHAAPPMPATVTTAPSTISTNSDIVNTNIASTTAAASSVLANKRPSITTVTTGPSVLASSAPGLASAPTTHTVITVPSSVTTATVATTTNTTSSTTVMGSAANVSTVAPLSLFNVEDGKPKFYIANDDEEEPASPAYLSLVYPACPAPPLSVSVAPSSPSLPPPAPSQHSPSLSHTKSAPSLLRSAAPSSLHPAHRTPSLHFCDSAGESSSFNKLNQPPQHQHRPEICSLATTNSVASASPSPASTTSISSCSSNVTTPNLTRQRSQSGNQPASHLKRSLSYLFNQGAPPSIATLPSDGVVSQVYVLLLNCVCRACLNA